MNREDAKRIIKDANDRVDPWADKLCDYMKASACTTCWYFALFSAGFILGCVVRGAFA